MKNSYDFLRKILDSITEHVVAIDASGDIQFANRSWSTFADHNHCLVDSDWSGINYIEECDRAAAMGDEFGLQAATGIKSVINNKVAVFYFEYPCHSPDQKRWFMMRVSPFQMQNKRYFVISHQNITERKLAEEEMAKLARTDGLTNIPNRRRFDQFLHDEWRRCCRLKKPISLAIIDLDHFKFLNDSYGHIAGDQCLIEVAALLNQFSSRPGDICARYGGEEFALVWSDTSLEKSKQLAEKILHEIADLNIANSKSPTKDYLTASIGLAEMVPSETLSQNELIQKADDMLYRAKENGRNRIQY